MSCQTDQSTLVSVPLLPKVLLTAVGSLDAMNSVEFFETSIWLLRVSVALEID